MFGEIHVETKLSIGLRVIQQLENLVNIETYITLGFHTSGSSMHLSFAGLASMGNDYESLDNWKFPAAGSPADSVYQSNTIIANFGGLTFNSIYQYDGSENVLGYNPTEAAYTRGSEIRVNGTLI